MAVLHAVVPHVPETRAAVVPARVARKLAPLFGLVWTESPFPITWVCDYGALTVSEIARGAPSPSRAATDGLPDDVPAGESALIGRAVVSHRVGRVRPEPLPNEIANATVNRFGPDTKAALVLAGTNALLHPVAESIVEALRFLDTQTPTGTLPLAARVGAWAALVLDVYCSQPALVTAALQARAIQRANVVPWTAAPLEVSARCEIGATRDAGSGPFDLEVLDSTIIRSFPSAATTLGVDSLREALVSGLHDRISGIGSAGSTGHVWLAQSAEGHRRAFAFVPNDPILTVYASYTDEVLKAAPGHRGPALDSTQLPSVPTPAQIAHLPECTRRCIILALCSLLRAGFGSGNPDPSADLHVLATLDGLADLMAGSLPARDAVVLIVRARLADMRLEVLRQDVVYDALLPAALNDLVDALRTALRRARRGDFDPGDAAELAFSGNVELLAVLRRTTDAPVPGVPDAPVLAASARELWSQALALLGADARRLDRAALRDLPIGFHLHNWATFLGRQASVADTREACQIFEEVVIPNRSEYYRRNGDFRPLLHSLQNAAAANGRLAAQQVGDGNFDAARRTSLMAREWMIEALSTPYTQRVLDDANFAASDEACRFALLAAPALLSALELGASPDRSADRRRCIELLDLATRFAESVGKGGGHYARSAEISAAVDRLDRLDPA